MPEVFDKHQLHGAVLAALQALVDNARQAVLTAYESATHEENIAENKYDTLGLEAAYLAQGQARRLAECEADLLAFQNSLPRIFNADDVITVGALVQVEDEDGHQQMLLLGPAAGGLKIQCNNQIVRVVTVAAPIGRALLNNRVGDSVSVPLGNTRKQYEIIAIC